MKKSFLILIVVLAISALGAAPLRTVRVTIINKSGMPVDVRLTGKYQEEIYYLRLPDGDRATPSEVGADVIPDQYNFEIFYVELWDPVYGSKCDDGTNSAEVTHSTRLTVLECSNQTRNNGEPPAILKYPQGQRSGGSRRR